MGILPPFVCLWQNGKSMCVYTWRAREVSWHPNSPQRCEVQGCNMSKTIGKNQSNSYLGKYTYPDDFVPTRKPKRKGYMPVSTYKNLMPPQNAKAVPLSELWLRSGSWLEWSASADEHCRDSSMRRVVDSVALSYVACACVFPCSIPDLPRLKQALGRRAVPISHVF